MPLYMSTQTEREKRYFYAIRDDGEVVNVAGFSCAPANPGTWWVPSLGYSMSEGGHLFDSERDAIEKSIRDLTAKAHAAQRMIRLLEERLK